MSLTVGMEYTNWKREAEKRGWPVPSGSRMAQQDMYIAWVRYWVAMSDYEGKRAAGDPDPGRPVQPHRSA